MYRKGKVPNFLKLEWMLIANNRKLGTPIRVIFLSGDADELDEFLNALRSGSRFVLERFS
jgi:hypothetical protein